MDEQWRDIPGYEGLYQVSDRGRIHSYLFGIGFDSDGRIIPGLVRQVMYKDGYLSASLKHINLKTKIHKVHTLVMLSFIGQRPAEHLVHHVDGQKWNNALPNLRYLSVHEHQKQFKKIYHLLPKKTITYKRLTDAATKLALEERYVQIAIENAIEIDGGILSFTKSPHTPLDLLY